MAAVWAERFDRDWSDLFTVQDEITRRVVSSLALTHNQDPARGWTADPVASRETALRFSREAVELDPTLPQAYLSLAAVSKLLDPEEAIEAARKAIELDPSSGYAYAQLGNVQIYLGQAHEALQSVDIALRLNPLAVAGYHRTRGRALYFEGRYAEAVGSLRRASEMNPSHPSVRFYLAAALAKLGRRDDGDNGPSALAGLGQFGNSLDHSVRLRTRLRYPGR